MEHSLSYKIIFYSGWMWPLGVWVEPPNEDLLKSRPWCQMQFIKIKSPCHLKCFHGDGQPAQSWLAVEQACSWRGPCAARSPPDSQSSKNGTVDVLLSFWRGSWAASAMGIKIELTSPSEVLWRWVYGSAIGLETMPMTRLSIFLREMAETWSFPGH